MFGSLAAAEGNVKVSLRDFAGEETWVSDFRYERFSVRAQRKECVAYTMDMKIRHVESLRDRGVIFPVPSADEGMVIGRSHGWSDDPEIEPQPIFGYMVTDPEVGGSKLKVVLIGSNHPHEHPACWTLHGMAEFLASDDPRAKALRRHAVFYVYPVVNPDGKVAVLANRGGPFRNVNGNPELQAAGETNHNRVWNTDGQFTSIDVVKTALLKDTGGSADYLLDIHGIPFLSFAFVRDGAEHSPLARVLMAKTGYTLRPGTDSPGTLRAWAASKEGFRAAYPLTPEMANGTEEEMLRQGKQLALAFYDLITGQIPPPRGLPAPEAEPEEPPAPLRSIVGDSDSAPIHKGVDLSGDLTVAVWVSGDEVPADTTPLVSQRDPAGDQVSWMLSRHGGGRQMIVTVSADGSRTGSGVKRYLSAGWPGFEVFDGTRRLVAFTFESGGGGRLRLYIDGAELKPGTGLHIFGDGHVPAPHSAGFPIVLGQAGADADWRIDGIGEVAIWDSALSAGQIRWLFENRTLNTPQ